MSDPKEFSCMDDDPRNNGWGYDASNPYDNYKDDLEDIPLEEDIDDEEN